MEEPEGHLEVILLSCSINLRAPSGPECITCVLHKMNCRPVTHHLVGENIIILVIIPNSKCCCSARQEYPSDTRYLCSPQISHIQCNLKETTENDPAHQCFSTTGQVFLLDYNKLWEVLHVIFLVISLWLRTQSGGCRGPQDLVWAPVLSLLLGKHLYRSLPFSVCFLIYKMVILIINNLQWLA